MRRISLFFVFVLIALFAWAQVPATWHKVEGKYLIQHKKINSNKISDNINCITENSVSYQISSDMTEMELELLKNDTSVDFISDVYISNGIEYALTNELLIISEKKIGELLNEMMLTSLVTCIDSIQFDSLDIYKVKFNTADPLALCNEFKKHQAWVRAEVHVVSLTKKSSFYNTTSDLMNAVSKINYYNYQWNIENSLYPLY